MIEFIVGVLVGKVLLGGGSKGAAMTCPSCGHTGHFPRGLCGYIPAYCVRCGRRDDVRIPC